MKKVIAVYAEHGDQNRERIADELAGLFASAGIRAEREMGVSRGGRDRPAVVMTARPTELLLAKDLLGALQPILRTRLGFTDNESLEIGKLRLAIYGEPQFLPDGAVTFDKRYGGTRD